MRRRLRRSLRRCLLRVSSSSARSSSESLSRSMFWSMALTASAPMPASNAVAVLLAGLAELLLGEELLVLERRVAAVDDDVVLEVDDPLQARRLHVQQRAEAGRHRLEEPDVHDGRGQVDVPHALAAHAAVRDLHAAPVADDALVLDALVLAAEALPVPLGTEDPLAEQAVLLGAVGAVVDGLRLLDLAVGPRTDVLRARPGGSSPRCSR